VIGSYSSIAVATPLYCLWKTREPRYAKLQKKYGEGVDVFEFDHSGTTGISSVSVARIEADKRAADKAAKEAARAAAKSEESKAEKTAEKKGKKHGSRGKRS